MSPKREASNHRCWALPVVTGGPNPGRGGDAIRIQSRPKGMRPRDAPLPKGLVGRNVVAILTGSTYQVASRIWWDAGRELARHFIVDTGSCVSLVREALLPPEMQVGP